MASSIASPLTRSRPVPLYVPLIGAHDFLWLNICGDAPGKSTALLLNLEFTFTFFRLARRSVFSCSPLRLLFTPKLLGRP